MSQAIRKNIAQKVKYYRQSKNLKREELSLTLGFDNSYISKLEKGRINITIDKLSIIANYFGIEPYELLK